MHEALADQDHVELRDLVRLFVHEGQRIFQDRLVETVDRIWTDDTINEITLRNFPAIDGIALKRPILYCSCISNHYEEVQREQLRELISAKLKVFNEEELNLQLVLFDEVLDHITRIDRVLRQPLGHLLLGIAYLCLRVVIYYIFFSRSFWSRKNCAVQVCFMVEWFVCIPN